MKKILMICSHFAPDNSIAAVRITKFAKCFHENGYEVIVIAEAGVALLEDEILKKDAEGIKVIRVENTKKAKKVLQLYSKIIIPLRKKQYDNLDNRVRVNPKTGKKEFYPFETAYPFWGSLDYLIQIYRQYDLSCQSKKYIKSMKDIDCLFTSYGDHISILAGRYFKKLNPTVPWIFDIRDPICRYKFTPKHVMWIAKLFEQYAWRKADAITAVSKGLCKRVSKKYRFKVTCITNGYDRDDRQDILYSAGDKTKLKFAYTGAMYGGLQDLSSVFSVLGRLINQKEIKKEEIEFNFAGKESPFDIFRSQAEKYDLGDRCVYHGRLERKDSLKLQMESDILLVSSFDYQSNEGGVITGKALEYMSADKPIIAIINGDIEHSELAEIIRTGNLGCAYEEAHHAVDNESLYYYLLEKYNEYKSNGRINHSPNQEVLKKYDYRYLGRKMLWVVNKVHEGRQV